MNSSFFPWKKMAIAASAVVVVFLGRSVIGDGQPAFSQQIHRPMTAANESVIDSNGKSAPAGRAITAASVKRAKPPIHHKKQLHKALAHASDSTLEKASGKTPNEAVYDDGPTPLNEMLVMSMHAPKRAEDKNHGSDDEAHPKAGWDNFEKYLSIEAVAPDGKSGNVGISFTVAPNGNLSDFRVRSSLNKQEDQKAIELLKNGPSWSGNVNKQPSEVNLSVSFH